MKPDLQAIRARAKAASRGDTFSPDTWQLFADDEGSPFNGIHVLTENSDPECWLHPGMNVLGRFEKAEDAAFAMHAHVDIPLLCDRVEQLEAQVKALQGCVIAYTAALLTKANDLNARTNLLSKAVEAGALPEG